MICFSIKFFAINVLSFSFLFILAKYFKIFFRQIPPPRSTTHNIYPTDLTA